MPREDSSAASQSFKENSEGNPTTKSPKTSSGKKKKKSSSSSKKSSSSNSNKSLDRQSSSSSPPPPPPAFADSMSTPPSSKRKSSSSSKNRSADAAAPVTPPPSKGTEYSRNANNVETPDTVRSGGSGGNDKNNALTINHVTSASRSSTIMGMSKPVMGLVSLLTLGSLGAGLWGWFTIPGLYDQIEELEAQVDRLANEVDRFEVLNDELNATVAELQVINQDLNATAADLRNSVDDLEHENNRLTRLNDNLESIVGFLNETSAQIGETLDDVTEYLAEQITASRVIFLETLENTYQQDMSNWDCAYRDVFRGEPFITNEDAPIGLANLGRVFDYVEDRVSCLVEIGLGPRWTSPFL